MEEEVFDEVGPHFRGNIGKVLFEEDFIPFPGPESLSEERSNRMRGGVL